MLRDPSRSIVLYFTTKDSKDDLYDLTIDECVLRIIVCHTNLGVFNYFYNIKWK